jgi:pimeloyl-ACP methyl ester carboxylesterase
MCSVTEGGADVASAATVVMHDEPVFFTSGSETLLGFHTRPDAPMSTDDPRDGVMLCSGGWLASSTGRNSTFVTLARALGSSGFHAFRFDYHGVGDSSGSLSRFSLREPFSEDALAAIECFGRRGVHSRMLVGSCFGGRTVLAVARTVEDLKGVVLIAVPPRDPVSAEESRERLTKEKARKVSASRAVRVGVRPWMLREVLRAERRRYYGRFVRAKLHRMRGRITRPVRPGPGAMAPLPLSDAFVISLGDILARNVPVLLLFGSEDQAYEQFLAARGTLRTLPGYAELVDELVLDGDVHGLGRVVVQQMVVESCVEWIANIHTRPDRFAARR